MSMTYEMEKMLDAIKSMGHISVLTEVYYYPDIPEKIAKKLLKYYDSDMPINTVLAFFDTSIIGDAKNGYVFTPDGFYDRAFCSKPVYFPYWDIKEACKVDGEYGVHITMKDGSRCSHYFSEVSENKYDQFIYYFNKLIEIDAETEKAKTKHSGNIKKPDMPEDMKRKCHGIIHTASVASGGAGTGLAQIPCSDAAVITPIQITMIVALGKVFDLSITESVAKSIIGSVGAAFVGRGISQVLVGWIPVIGNAINTATAAGITETIGWIAADNFYNRWLEDKNKGKYEGMKQGYNEASEQYEKKFRKQAEEYFNQEKDWQTEKDEYEKLIDDLLAYIRFLESQFNTDENKLNEMRDLYNKLNNLAA